MTASPLVLPVPLFSQADNPGGNGWRECMSSSCAMLAAYHGLVKTDDAYCQIRNRHGDTTDPAAQLRALRELGLKATFTAHADRATVEAELRNRRPVAVGWLHHGHVSAPSGGGHWSVLAGFSQSAVWMQDPNGEADLVRGGYVTAARAWQGWYSWRNWGARWDLRPVPLPGQPSRPSGWAIFVTGRA